MEPAYLYKMPVGTSLFRAKTIQKTGRWHSLSLNDAYTYGTNITEFVTNKDLCLINVMSLTFHNDLMDRLMIRYPGINYDGIDIDKLICLIPLGLFDKDTQNLALGTTKNYSLPQNGQNWDILMQFGHLMLHSRQRYSDHEVDTKFVNILEEIYGDVYDGFISPIKWPTKCHASGGYFPREMCIFKDGLVNEVQEHLRPDQMFHQSSVAAEASSSSGGGNPPPSSTSTFWETWHPPHDQVLSLISNDAKQTMVYRDWNPFLDDGFPKPSEKIPQPTRTKRKGGWATKKKQRM